MLVNKNKEGKAQRDHRLESWFYPRRFSFDGARWDEKFIPSLELLAVLLNQLVQSWYVSYWQ